MAEANIKNDIESAGKQGLEYSEKISKQIFTLLSNFFQGPFKKWKINHSANFDGIRADGPTDELEKIDNLSYEELIEMVVYARENNIPVNVVEFKDGNNSPNNAVGKNRSVSRTLRIAKTQEEINEVKQKILKNQNKPRKLNRLNKELTKLETLKKQQIKDNEGDIYSIYFNKSRASRFVEPLNKIYANRMGVAEDFIKNNPEFSKVKEMINQDGFDLNNEQIKEVYGDFMNVSSTDISNFKENYYIHTMKIDDWKMFSRKLKSSGLEYGVNFQNSREGNNGSNGFVDVFIADKDYTTYSSIVGSEKINNIQHIKSSVDVAQNNQVAIEMNKSEISKFQEAFQGYNYTIIENKSSDKVNVLVDKDTVKDVYEFQKKRNPAQEDIDRIKKERAAKERQSKSKTATKEDSQKGVESEPVNDKSDPNIDEDK